MEIPAIKKAYCRAQWNGPAPGMIDPVKEVSAAKERIAIGVSTRQRESIEMTGTDFDANVAQLTRENQLMKEAGLTPAAAPPGDGENKNQKESEKTDEDEEDKDPESDTDTGDESEDQ